MLTELLSAFYLIKYDQEGVGIMLAIIALMLIVYVYAAYYLIFKSEWIINKLKLDQGFVQDSFPLNIHRSTVIGICIIVIGGLMVVDEIPNLCGDLYTFYQENRMPTGETSPTLLYSIISAAKILIGVLLIGYQRKIVNFIEVRRKIES